VTGPKDAIEQYYRPGIGGVLRRRLSWVLDCLPAGRIESMLEVGYGSGVFQYELVERASLCVGVDLHPNAGRVKRRLSEDGIEASLIQADATRLPFGDEAFQVVVVVSVIEHTADPMRCLFNCGRVLRRGGRLICLIPRQMKWSDSVFRFLTGIDPEADFQGGRERADHAIETLLPGCRRLRRPAYLPAGVAPYEVVVFDRPFRDGA
jgi:SAM-dependent methyltransferase